MSKSPFNNQDRSTAPRESRPGGEYKIGLVLPSVPGYSETFFRNKIRGLQLHGYRVILFVNQAQGGSSFLDVPVIRAPQLNGPFWKVWGNTFLLGLQAVFVRPRRSYRLYRQNQKDGISFSENCKSVLANQFLLKYALDCLHFGFGTMALGRENVAAVIGAKMAVSFRGFDYYVYPVKNPTCYQTLFTKEVRYHVLSEAMKKGLIQQGLAEKEIFKITPAIDTRFFDTAGTQPHQQFQIKTIARLHWIKGINYILEALALLKKKNMPFHYTLIGEGEEKERLLFAVHQLGLTEHISFLGKLPPEQVKKELETTDIYLQYSQQEGFCNAVLEAQAMGVLCVVSDAEGLRENVLDGQTGFVVPKRNPKLLAQKLTSVFQLPESHKQTLCLAAQERVRNQFTLEKQQQEFLKFYDL